MDENFRVVTDNNVSRFMERLYVETNETEQELFQKLLLWEERWYGLKQERLEALERNLRDCDGRILRHRALINEQVALGVDVTKAEILFNNLLDVQQMLRNSLRQEFAAS
jgi:hypothetical protein